MAQPVDSEASNKEGVTSELSSELSSRLGYLADFREERC